MTIQKKHIRHGFGVARPYVYGRLALAELIERTFEAAPLERHGYPDGGFHIEYQIGDSVVVLEVSDAPLPSAVPSSIYVYVEDVDAIYARALAAGAASVAEPADKPYQERSAGIRDSFGNTWWISTYTGPEPSPPVTA